MPKPNPKTTLRKANQRFHNSIVNFLGRRNLVRKRLVAREQYFKRLQQNDPFFKKLFDGKIEHIYNRRGQPEKFTVLKKGVKKIKLVIEGWDMESGSFTAMEGRMIFTLDHLGRVRFFFKENNRGAQWSEVRQFKQLSPTGLEARFTGIARTEAEEARELRTLIGIDEKKIDFKNLNANAITKVLKFL